ncbi:unnamed protein product [Urochloa humidicola]
MESLSFLQVPRVSLPVSTTAAAAASLTSRRPLGTSACRVPRRRRHGARLSSATQTPRTGEAPSPSPSPSGGRKELFDWLDQWYPIAPVCDLDPGAPHGRTVLGLRVVAWYDRAGGGEWRVFADACPHRLAPLSEGRIDGDGRLQCVYHGWCFDGAGACKFIPQAPALVPPVHENSRACVASYPCVVQIQVLWFCSGRSRKLFFPSSFYFILIHLNVRLL